MVLRWHDALLGHAYMLQGRFDEAIERLDVAIAGCTAMQLLWTSMFGLLIKAGDPARRWSKAAAAACRRSAEVGPSPWLQSL